MGTSFSKSVLLIFVVVAASFSCTDRREDHSLTVDEYIKLGMPDPGKSWDMDDYTQANNVLAKIKWEKPLELPAKDSEKSGLVFDRMVSLDYLSFLQDTTLSLNAKAERISDFTRVYDHWMDIYTIPMLKHDPYQGEKLELQIFNLRLMEAMVNLMHKINESDDPADAGLKYGHQYIMGNYLTSLYASLRMQASTSEHLQPDLERMADSIYASVIRNKEWMGNDALSSLRRSLNSVIDSTSSERIRSKYHHLRQALAGRSTVVSQ